MYGSQPVEPFRMVMHLYLILHIIRLELEFQECWALHIASWHTFWESHPCRCTRVVGRFWRLHRPYPRVLSRWQPYRFTLTFIGLRLSIPFVPNDLELGNRIMLFEHEVVTMLEE